MTAACPPRVSTISPHIIDAEVDGTDLAVPYDAVLVTNGLFNVTLDFGPDIFSGPARWLEISVRASGVGDPSILAPRTPLLPTPHAIFANKAEPWKVER